MLEGYSFSLPYTNRALRVENTIVPPNELHAEHVETSPQRNYARPNNTNSHSKELGLSKVQLYGKVRQSRIQAQKPDESLRGSQLESQQIEALSLEVDRERPKFRPLSADIRYRINSVMDNDIHTSTHYIYPLKKERSGQSQRQSFTNATDDKEIKVTEFRDGNVRTICEAPKLAGKLIYCMDI